MSKNKNLIKINKMWIDNGKSLSTKHKYFDNIKAEYLINMLNISHSSYKLMATLREEYSQKYKVSNDEKDKYDSYVGEIVLMDKVLQQQVDFISLISYALHIKKQIEVVD